MLSVNVKCDIEMFDLKFKLFQFIIQTMYNSYLIHQGSADYIMMMITVILSYYTPCVRTEVLLIDMSKYDIGNVVLHGSKSLIG